ncbi:Transcription factor DIVARICATA [Quillaja saponaria]|nr:Transcription factor DIVARICATA [Quillaja saponaria]
MIPGKTVGDVIKQYKELEEDVINIEAGLIPIPGYTSSSITLEWVNNQDIDGLEQFCSLNGKRGTTTRPSEQERKKGVPWTEDEHRQFLMGLKECGKGDWRNISRNFVTTRTPTQVASHAQKYFIRQLTGGKDKRRSSIHDITTINLPDTKSNSPDNNRPPCPDYTAKVVHQPRDQKISSMVKQQYDWTLPYEGATVVFNSGNGNVLMPPFCGISSYENKLQELSLLRGTIHGSQFGPYDAIFQMQSMQHQ